MGFIRIQPQVYSRLINNLQRVGNLIYKHTLELKRDPRKTAQISEPPQRGEASLYFVIIRDSKESKLGDGKAESFQELISPQNGRVELKKTQLYEIITGRRQQKHLGPPSPINNFLLCYRL